MIDKIIVTGCSFSTGIDFIDYELGYPSLNNRRSAIWKWYKKNYPTESKGLSIEELDQISNQKFHNLEREHSWPALLQKKTGIPVINLSVAGASIGRTLIEFSKYCKENKNTNQTIAIHQLPVSGRFYMRFVDGRTDIVPKDFVENFYLLGFSKKHFQKDIEKVKNNYEQIIKKDIASNYIEKHYHSCLKRIKKISDANQIKSFFITPQDINLENVIINNFYEIRSKYQKNHSRHPVDPNYNKELVDIIRSKLNF